MPVTHEQIFHEQIFHELGRIHTRLDANAKYNCFYF